MKIRGCLNDITPYVPGVLKPGAIKLASNENPLGPSPAALEAIRRNLERVSLYPDGSCAVLREKLAARYGLRPGNFILGNGSDEIFVFIAGLLVEPSDEIVTSEVTFSEYAFAARLFGGVPVFTPMRAGTYDPDGILARINGRTRVIFIANPNNPTGTRLSHEAFAAFMKKVPAEVLVVADEAYREYAQDPGFPDALALMREHRNLLVTRTFSKLYGLAGLRVGYAIGDEELIALLNRTRTPFNIGTLAQVAAVAALDDEAFIQRSIDNNEAGKRYLYGELGRLGLRYYPTHANFIYIEIGMDCREAFRKIMDLGMTIRPLASFGVTDAIRVTVGTPEQNRFFVECLEKVITSR